ncbi:VOC family protein [Pseudactinotalea terrae]|uniref:VOC family protein n=1 Tax=Pseudactinotalea terrae TaxID=1743262 RepID=UPI0012E1755D|nr:VOC family protein [Pseudactinotalea terrae]
MDQYLSLVTLAVPDLDAARRFYVDGLGWHARQDGGDVIFLQVGPGLVLSLWELASFREEVGEPVPGLAPMTLAHNVADPARVDAVLEAARRAGASEVVPGRHREWGGYSGYFADPAGFRWEVAHNPFDTDLAQAGQAWAKQQR